MVSGKNKELFDFLDRFEITAISASVSSNIVLVYFILYRSSKEIGAYRHLLLAFALNDIVFPIVHLLTLPVICTYKDAFIMFAHGTLTSSFAIALYGSIFSQTMPLLAHLFIYRLIALKWPTNLRLYTGKTCFILIAISLGVEVPLWFTNNYVNMGSNQEIKDYVEQFLEEEFDGEGKEFIGMLFYSEDGTFHLQAFFTTMSFNVIMIICLSVIVFCSFAIVRHFRSKDVVWSGKTKRMQQQLFRTLFVQMVIPMIIVYFPCAGIMNLPMYGLRINVFPNLVSASLTLFPLIDALTIIVGVHSYRNTIISFFKSKTKKISQSSSSAANTSPTK